jgi:predicted class III extradiol MEMO1 family dioxygenase
MAESEDTAKKKEIENTLLHSFDMQKVTLTGNQAWDLAVLNNKSQVLTSKMGYDASLIKDLTTQAMASMTAVSTKDGLTDAGKTTIGNNMNATALAGASAFLNADYSSSSPIPSTASTAQQQQLAEIYNFLSSADSATVEKASKLVADAKATSKPKTT